MSRMEEVEVYVSTTGQICLVQPIMFEDEAIITIHPSQVYILIKWLRAAKKEIEQSDNE